MPLAVIDHVNLLGHAERSLLVFTDRHGQVIGDYTPTVGKTDDTDASVLSAVNDLVPSEMHFPCLWLLSTVSICLVMPNVLYWCSLIVMDE